MRHLLKSPCTQNRIIRHLLKKMSSFAESTVQYAFPSPGERVAFRQSPGKSPGVIFLPGLMSTMEGTKALALERYCKKIGHSYVRFDYRGHGMSSGKSQECTIGMRKEDVLTILDGVAKGGTPLRSFITRLECTWDRLNSPCLLKRRDFMYFIMCKMKFLGSSGGKTGAKIWFPPRFENININFASGLFKTGLWHPFKNGKFMFFLLR